ncbi:MAG: hypothetical protein NT052_01050 [Candidatus Shapirobacteria bacterium]|nr:hypothetical protein [Candidatus Shapirobacteria bacterium]
MPNHKEYLRNTVGFLPKVESDDELLKEKKQLINIGSRAADGALGLGLFRLGDSIEGVKDLLSEGYEFLEKDLEEDLEIIEKGSDYPILKRIEKH